MSVFPPGPTTPGQPGTPAFPPPTPGAPPTPQTGLPPNTGFTGSVQGAGNTNAPGFIPPSTSNFVSPSALAALGLPPTAHLTLGAAMQMANALAYAMANPPRPGISALGVAGLGGNAAYGNNPYGGYGGIGPGIGGIYSGWQGGGGAGTAPGKEPSFTGPGLGPAFGIGNPAGTPGIGSVEVETLLGMSGANNQRLYMNNDWTSAGSGAASPWVQNTLFPLLASGGGGGDSSGGASGWEFAGDFGGGSGAPGGAPQDFGASVADAFGSQSGQDFSPQNFSDPLSGLQMPPVDTSQQNKPSWLAGIGGVASGALDQFFNPSQQPAEIFQGGLPATAEFQPTFANMEQAFQGGLPASPGPPETPPAVPDYQGGLPASPGPQAPPSATEQIIKELQGQQQQSAFQGGLPAAPAESTFAGIDLGSLLSVLRGGGTDVTSTFQGGLPAAPASPEGVAGAAIQADPLGLMGGLPAVPPSATQGFGGGSPTQVASQVPSIQGAPFNPDLPPEVQAAGTFGGMFPNTSWPAFEAGARPSQNIEDMRSFAIPAAEPDSASFIWPDASNPNRDILGSGPLTTLAPSDAGLPSGSPGLTPDVVSPTVPFDIQPTAQAPDFGGLPVESNQVVVPPDFGGLTPLIDPLQGQGFGGGSQTEEPQGWPNFTPKPEPMETWNIPQSKADILVQKYGQKPTLRQIVVGENGSEPFGFGLLGSGVDTPIDLSKPIEPQLTAALGGMAGQAVPLIMGKMAGAGMTGADIMGAARGAANPNYFPPGSGPGTGPVDDSGGALSGPSNFQTLQSGSPWGAEPSMEPQTMPGAATDFGPAPTDAFGGAPQNPQGFGGGSENEQLTQLPLSNPVLAALRKPGMDFLSTPEGERWASQNIAGVAPMETPAASKEGFNFNNLVTWFDAQANRGLGKGLDIQQTYENNVPGYGSFWPGAGTIAGTANAHVGTALNPETGLPASYYNNAGTKDPTGAAIQHAQIMDALLAAYGGSPYGGLINNSGANYANMDPSKAINMPAPNTINFSPSVYGEGFAASPQQGVYNLVKQYNATANAMFPGAVPANLSPMEIQSILMNARGNTMSVPQQFQSEDSAFDPAIVNQFQNTNWPAFEAGARPSQNIEDARTLAGSQNLILQMMLEAQQAR